MPDRLPRLRWLIIAPIILTGLLLGFAVMLRPTSPPVTALLRTAVRTFFAVSFIVIGIGLIYRLLVVGFDGPKGD